MRTKFRNRVEAIVYDIHSFDALRSIAFLFYSLNGVQLQVLLVVER